MALKLSVLDPEDAEMRKELIEDAYNLIKREKIPVPKYADEEVVDFVLEWQYPRRHARDRVSQVCESDSGVAPRIYEVYSHERLYILYRYAVWCEWLSPEEMLRAFSDLTKLFMAIRGKTPDWWHEDVPFQALLRAVFIEVNRRLRAQRIREYLSNNWEEAERLFEDREGVPSGDFPSLPGLEYSHVYTQYRRMQKDRGKAEARKYLREHPKEKEQLCQTLKTWATTNCSS